LEQLVSEDALWPRASNWLQNAGSEASDLGLFGVPAFETSITATAANTTPNEIRDSLTRYSTYSWSNQTDLSTLAFSDFGDSEVPDSEAGEQRTMDLASKVASSSKLAIALGGDNSITYAVMRGVFGESLSSSALVTFDAHHDLRDGISNGSPVRRLIESGLPGNQVVQIGIADFSNSPAYAKRAKDLGIHVIPRSELRNRTPKDIWQEVVSVIGDRQTHVDFDMDVCDRSVVPGCPAAAPGGISADELRQFAFLVGNTKNVKSFDITEIDAMADSADGRTIRLAALTILEAAAGFKLRV
jgi:formiminoglutamase